MSEACCRNCHYFLNGFECHRLPPLVNGWPQPDEYEWCGEWRLAEEVTP